jgi:hypothetical protein
MINPKDIDNNAATKDSSIIKAPPPAGCCIFVLYRFVVGSIT